MESPGSRAVAIVGLGAILPDAMSPQAFWENLLEKRYSITETPRDRWSIDHYYDPDPLAPDKTYSIIGGWVKGFEFDWKRFRIPPKVAGAMDQAQQWAVTIADQALTDYGYPTRPLNTERTGVILGTAMGGELHYLTHLRIAFPEYAQALKSVTEFSSLPPEAQARILAGWHDLIGRQFPNITEDSMPGELPNVVSGRVANVLNLRGGNFITDAACAASFAAVSAAIELLYKGEVDAVITGGVDRNMGASTFVKFCKIGALSATGTRPFGEGADGFVMGEGAAAFLLKRLEDAERDGDRIYAVLRGAGGASDGKGKGITAPNPYGQQLAVRRAWDCAGLDPTTAGMIEAHGTSTRVGDLAEAEGLTAVFGKAASSSIALGSVKSNIGHLKAGAGAAGLLKAVLSIYHGVIPPTLNADPPNPNIPFDETPFYLNHEAREWPASGSSPRRCGVSAFGFGGTNFHLVLEEHIPGALTSRPRRFASAAVKTGGLVLQDPEPTRGPTSQAVVSPTMSPHPGSPTPFRGIFALGAATPAELQAKLAGSLQQVQAGSNLDPVLPSPETISSPARLVIDYKNRPDLLEKLHKAAKAMATDNPQAWKALQPQGIFRGQGPCPGKLVFLFPGQGSQYLNMGRELRKVSPVVARVFAEADRVMEPILGKPLSAYFLLEADDPEVIKQAEHELKQTAITQPAMLTLDIAIHQLLESFGYRPEMVMGHSLGEYAALVVAGVLPFAQALEAAAARGSEMSKVRVDDTGWMAAIMAPLDTVEQTLRSIDGYVVIANLNSYNQCVIGGESKAVEQAIQVFQDQGFNAVRLPVSHAFHTRIVAPASAPLRQVLDRFDIKPPRLPLVANVTGEFYPLSVEEIKDILQQQIASPVQWVKGLETLYAAGARLFVEAGPKKALKGMVDDVLGAKPEVTSIFTNHPKTGELASFNHALCGLLAAGHLPALATAGTPVEIRPIQEAAGAPAPAPLPETVKDVAMSTGKNGSSSPTLESLVQLLAQAIQQPHPGQANLIYNRYDPPVGSVVITGLGLGLPGAEKQVMDPDNAVRILRGEQFIDLIPDRFRKRMVAKRVTRVVKAEHGGGSFQTIEDPDEVIRLAGRPGQFDLEHEYGVSAKIVESLDITTQLAMAAGFDALREAGIPLVQTYRTATTGKLLPDRWLLPESLRDETGVIFASAFPGGDRFADEFRRYFTWQNRIDMIQALEDLRRCTSDPQTLAEIHHRLSELREQIEQEPYTFDRRFLFRVLAMGHSQFAEYIGARGPNTQVNAACASTTQAIAIAEDWIRSGRCRRVIVIAADAVTSDNLMEWVGAGFLAVGAAATDDRVDEAAIPFDRRRHGTLMGMGACALVIESEDAVRERGMRGIVELLSSETYNSAFHGTRLDVAHIAQVMEKLVAGAERRFGLNRYAIAPYTVFMSHETYTPARGGSASAEVVALRHAFGEAANQIIVSNTKGFTGHPMGVGIEDVIAAKILEYGIVPPVPNFKEVDPDLGPLNLSRGGRYPVQYAIHLAAGFGSQIAMTFTRRIPGGLDRVDDKVRYRHWLSQVSGWDRPETEVVKRVLRLKALTPPNRPPAPSAWQPGTEPQVRTAVHAAIPGGNGYHPPLPVEASPAVEGRTPAAIPPLAEPPLPSPQAEPQPQAQQPAAQQAVPVTAETRPVEPPASIAGRVLAIVAEKIGYPTDMLDLDLDLEADLGVDTVKQAETFAAIREEFCIPRQENLRLRDYPTLGHVIRFVEQMTEAPAEPQPGTQLIETPPASPDIQSRVLAIVAEKTGYPTDMLDLDLDLEADLGVDTVKQAETFAAIRAEFDIPRQEDLRLRDYPTLAHVIRFVEQMVPAPVETPTPVERQPDMPPAGAQPEETRPTSDIQSRVLAIVSEKTGYPPEMLELDLDLEADLGVDTVKQAETFAAIRAEFDIPRQEDLRLRDYPTLAHVIRFVEQMVPAPVETPTPVERQPDMPPAGAQPEETRPTSDIQSRVLAIVSEKTGYPPEMLELDLDLEADLGVDTVKQAETFAAIRAEFDIPRQEDLKLRDYPTLAHVIRFVERMMAPIEPAAPPEPQASAPPVEVRTAEAAADETGTAHGIKFSVPLPVLRPPIELCKPTGASIGPGTRLIVAGEGTGVAAALTARLEELGAQVLALDVQAGAAEIETQVKAWLEEQPVAGVYWLAGLEPEPGWEELDLKAWKELNRQQVKNLFLLMHLLAEGAPSSPAFLVSATRLGGLHGYPPQPAPGALGGAVTGFTKAYKREMPQATVKAVDFAPGESPAVIAEALVQETLWDPGVVEVGYWDGGRYTIALQEQPSFETGAEIPVDQGAVIVVTGAAGSITSLIVADLARRCPGTYYLLDLASCPEADSPEIAIFRQGREDLKKHLVKQAKDAGERTTPAKIDRRILEIERLASALSAIEAVTQAGGQARYHSLDLLDPGAVSAVIDEIRGASGKIDLLVHAAGIEISRPLADKDPAQFAKVYDVKTESLFNLLKAAAGLPLGTVLSFSSVAGRFGNAGQTDYSAANDLLCKLTSALPAWRTETRGITIDWTAWGEIGMATRGSIPKIMEMAGIDLLPPAVGVPLPGDLLAAGFSGELVVAGSLGLFSQEWDDTGGLDPDKANAWLESCPPHRLMAGRITAAPGSGTIQLEAALDPQEQPFLFDHQIEDIPVLPGVMGVEAFAQVSSLFAPGYEVEAVEGVAFEQPFKFYRMQTQTLRYDLRLAPTARGALLAHLVLRSITPPARPELLPVVRTHFTGQVLLVRSREQAPQLDHFVPEGDWCTFTAGEIYQTYFHGPAYRVLDCARVQGDIALGMFAPDLPPATHPADAPLWMAPRLVELCLQTAGLWAIHHQRGLALPYQIGSVRVYRQEEEAAGKDLFAWIQTGDDGATFDGHVFDSEGAFYLTLTGYRTVQIPV